MRNDGFTNDRIEEINLSTINAAKREYKLTEQQFNELKELWKKKRSENQTSSFIK